MSTKDNHLLTEGLIKGIGGISVAALLGGGINTIEDIARSTPDKLEQILKQQGVTNITAKRINNENWIDQAKAMTQEDKPGSTSTVVDKPEGSQAPKWRQYAGFQIYFDNESGNLGPVDQEDWRVRVKHIETGQQKKFKDAEKWRWLPWILERAGLPTSEALAALSPASVEVTTAPVHRTTEGGNHMNEHKLNRGGVEITLKKVPDAFAVRLKKGRATSAEALEATVGRSETAVQHLDSTGLTNMEIFTIAESDLIENTTDTMRKSAAADVVSHVYALGDSPDSIIVPSGAMMIQFKEKVSKTQREAILKEFGLDLVKKLDFMEDAYRVRLTRASPHNPLRIAEALQQRDEIVVAEPDLVFKVQPAYTPSDARYLKQWHLKNRGDQLSLLAGADVKAEEAWEHQKGQRSIIICIIDDGFELDHPDFNKSGKIIAPIDFGERDDEPRPVTNYDSHGTACAGVAVAEEGRGEVVGLASGCALMPVRMSGWLSDEEVIAYFEHAVQKNASVISCSWRAGALYAPLSTTIDRIIQWAATEGRDGKGCVILFAAGNDYGPLQGIRDWDGQPMHLGFALHPDVMAIAASNSLDQHSEYSNFGPEISVCAPSSGYPGRGIVTTDLLGVKGTDLSDYRSDFGGTSSATPLVAGLAGLILSAYPDLTATELREIIEETADKIDEAGGDFVNGHSDKYGYGRINAYKAILRTIELRDGQDTESPEISPTIELSIIAVKPSIQPASTVVPTTRLRVDVHYQLSGNGAAELLNERSATHVTLSLANRDNGAESHLLAETRGRLKPNQWIVVETLTYPLPDNGRYVLHTAVSVQISTGQLTDEHRLYLTIRQPESTPAHA